MKNIDEKILMAEEEIKQLQNKRKKLISKQKQEERKKRDRRLYEKGGVFESIFAESKDFIKDEFYQLITFPNIKEAINQKILKIIEKREEIVYKNTENQEEEMDIEEWSLVYKGAIIHPKGCLRAFRIKPLQRPTTIHFGSASANYLDCQKTGKELMS